MWLDVAVGCSVVGPRFHVPSLFAYYVLAALTWTTHHAVNICAMVPVHVYPGSTQYMYTGTRVLEYGHATWIANIGTRFYTSMDVYSSMHVYTH